MYTIFARVCDVSKSTAKQEHANNKATGMPLPHIDWKHAHQCPLFDFIRLRQRGAPIDSNLQIAMVQSIFLACSLITSCIQLGGWAVAYALRTEKFYDILGGLNFLAVGAFSAATAEGWEADPRKVWW